MNKFTYAILNAVDICEGISTTHTIDKEIHLPKNCVLIEEGLDAIYKKYNRKTREWSEEKFEPKSIVPLDRLEQLEKQNADLAFLLVEKGVL